MCNTIHADLVPQASLASLSQWKTDGAKKLASQIALKGYFAGEAAGVRLASHAGQNSDTYDPNAEIECDYKKDPIN